jgi:dienelactone hydrolase
MEPPMHKPLPFLVALLFAVPLAHGAIKTQAIDYQEGGANLQGYLAYDDAIQGPRPGVLVVPEWWGRNDFVNHRAEELAKLGYTAFAVDMYGKGIVAQTPEEATKLATPLMTDRALLRARAQAGLDVLRKDPHVDPDRIAAIGFCFGGTTSIELARAGEPLRGIVSFHGGLAPGKIPDAKITAKVLVLSGADDAFVPPEQVTAFADEMRKAGADWQVVLYSGAVHAFTNPEADSHHMKNIAYNASADHRSWQAMRDFFAEIFK